MEAGDRARIRRACGIDDPRLECRQFRRVAQIGIGLFEPETERFTVFPLPTRVTYTREIDFDGEGRVWTSNSNVPAWQIEGGTPRVLRLDPRGIAAEELTRAVAVGPERSR